MSALSFSYHCDLSFLISNNGYQNDITYVIYLQNFKMMSEWGHICEIYRTYHACDRARIYFATANCYTYIIIVKFSIEFYNNNILSIKAVLDNYKVITCVYAIFILLHKSFFLSSWIINKKLKKNWWKNTFFIKPEKTPEIWVSRLECCLNTHTILLVSKVNRHNTMTGNITITPINT